MAPKVGLTTIPLCKLVAARVGLAPSQVAVRRGAAARDKQLELRGIDEPAMWRALGADPE